MSLAEQEPVLRMAISSIENSLDRASQLPRTDYDSSLDSFRHHAEEAIHQLRSWAQANEIEILERMKT